MDKFTTLHGIAAPMIIPNVTTDAISPSAANISASIDLGQMLFADWRYELDKSEKPDFILNNEPFRRARIIVGGPNFGCGSSRERAVWALWSFGIRCVIAPSFADIFRSNSYQNGLLPVELPERDFAVVQAFVENDPHPELTVDLVHSLVELPDGRTIPFSIPDDRREAMLEGLDEIDVLLKYAEDIGRFQINDAIQRPWIYHLGEIPTGGRSDKLG